MVIREPIDHGGPQGGQAVRLEKLRETMVSGMVHKGVVSSLFFDLLHDFISFLRNPDIERFPQDLPI